MTAGDFIEIVGGVASWLDKMGTDFRSIKGVERRIGQDGFNWQIGINADLKGKELERAIIDCATYIAATGNLVVFSLLEIPHGRCSVFDYESFWQRLKIPSARGVTVYDPLSCELISRIDFLFRPDMMGG